MTRNKLPKLAFPKLTESTKLKEKKTQEEFLAKIAELDKKFNEK